MKIPNEEDYPHLDWDGPVACGHTLRFHVNQIEQKMIRAFGMTIKEFNQFVADLKLTCDEQLHTQFSNTVQGAVAEITNQNEEELRLIMIDSLVSYIEKQLSKYDEDKSLLLAQSIMFLVQTLEKEFKWDLPTFRNDLYIRVTKIMINHWEDLFPGIPMPI